MPHDDEAPGLKSIARKDGTTAWYWVAANVSRKAADYRPKTVRLHHQTPEERAARCRVLSAELREWLFRNGQIGGPEFRGTLETLIDCYQREDYSPYRQVRANTRETYDRDLKTLKKTVGKRRIESLTRRDFARWHTAFAAPLKKDGEPRIRRAHGLMTMLRIVLRFGKSERYAGCRDAVDVLEEMKFPLPERRGSAMTYLWAEAVVRQGIAMGLRSVALAQALQFELGLRQIDVIGRWIEAGGDATGITFRSKRWTGGRTWAELGAERLALRTSKTGAEGEWSLRDCPLVVLAAAAFADDEKVGPAIIDERTGQPYKAKAFARVWRKVATAAGVPDSVWNMDSRAGAASEARDAGAAIEDIQQFMTHADPATTRRYIRNGLVQTERVRVARLAFREKKGGGE